jgi:hypothetical protein
MTDTERADEELDEAAGMDAVGWAPPPPKPGEAEAVAQVEAEGQRAAEELPPGDDVTEGETIARIEAAFPFIWGAILLLVCLIGVYYSVSNLPR